MGPLNLAATRKPRPDDVRSLLRMGAVLRRSPWCLYPLYHSAGVRCPRATDRHSTPTNRFDDYVEKLTKRPEKVDRDNKPEIAQELLYKKSRRSRSW